MSRGLRMAAVIAALGLSSPVFAADIDWKKVEDALGKAGAVQPDGVYRVGLPRSDLKVTLDGVEIRPALALGSWLAFEPAGDDAMVMGDLVLTQDEVNPVMKSLAEGGIEITALHNHLLRSSPATMYMHVEGHGDPAKLAATLHAALALSGTPFATPSASGSPQTFDLDTAKLDDIIGQKGKINGGVYQFTVPRAEPVSDAGMAVPRSMGTGIAINFQPTEGGKAAITGDFVLTASEVNPVLLALREHGIEVTALHNHMLNDEPRLFFMHFWANADAQTLAKGLRVALDQMNIKKS
jgi:Domain of Unknown Function (DUF1259)